MKTKEEMSKNILDFKKLKVKIIKKRKKEGKKNKGGRDKGKLHRT